MGGNRAFAGVSLTLAALALLPAAPAFAASLAVADGTVAYRSAPGEADSVDVYYDTARARYVLERPSSGAVTPGPGCAFDEEIERPFHNIKRYSCNPEGVSAVLIDLGDGQGFQFASAEGSLPARVTIRAAPTVGGGFTYVWGSAGDDLIEVTGPGETVIHGNRGADTIRGGSAKDRVEGGSGGDHIEGGDGDDLLFGDFGGDWEKTPDNTEFESGATPGKDVIDGGPGVDRMIGGNGDDTLTADVLADRAWCDRSDAELNYHADGGKVPRSAPGDVFNAIDDYNDGMGCETVKLVGGAPPAAGPPQIKVSKQRLRPAVRAGLRLVATSEVAGKLTIGLRLPDAVRRRLKLPRQVGRVQGRTVQPGANTLTVPFSPASVKRPLQRLKSLTLTLNIRFIDRTGTLVTAEQPVTLKR